MGIFDIFRKKDSGQAERATLESGLEKSREGIFSKISRAVAGKSKVDEEVLDELEEILITADVGVDTTLRIIERIEARVARDKYLGTDELNTILRDEVTALLAEAPAATTSSDLGFLFEKDKAGNPFVLMVVGVNGVGKTTTIGKIGAQLKKERKKVLLCAADTFRAAAAEQLTIWADRSGLEIIRQHEGADPAAVVFDAASAAKARNTDVVLVDTAGRLHNKQNLMNELNKISRVIDRELPGCAKETLLVLDATTGQNGLIQAKQFREAAGITGIVLTKLDGTAKGGIAIAIARELGVPVKYAGVGEGIDDLRPFDALEFAQALI